MIRVGFLLNFPVEYKGGINYLKNLFYAVNKFYKNDVEVVLFVSSDLDIEYLNLFKDYAVIVKTDLLKRKSLFWLTSRISEKLFDSDPLTNSLLRKHQINILSHSNYVYPGREIKTVNWIPDFQYLHYPQLFSKKELAYVNKWHHKWISQSDLIVVSSKDAYKDLESIHSKYTKKVRVLHFVSQPDILNNKVEVNAKKYADGKFFYLPNQFWQHKNHLTVFKAVKILKEKGINCQLLTSGLIHDFRNKNLHVNRLQQYVVENGLSDRIKFLGLIPYSDVLQLIKTSTALINPSFFEGWSSTVEESKSIGKKIILSDIPVHREQNPENSQYFKPDDENMLASIIENVLSCDSEVPDLEIKPHIMLLLNERTKEFAKNYINILHSILD